MNKYLTFYADPSDGFGEVSELALWDSKADAIAHLRSSAGSIQWEFTGLQLFELCVETNTVVDLKKSIK